MLERCMPVLHSPGSLPPDCARHLNAQAMVEACGSVRCNAPTGAVASLAVEAGTQQKTVCSLAQESHVESTIQLCKGHQELARRACASVSGGTCHVDAAGGACFPRC